MSMKVVRPSSTSRFVLLCALLLPAWSTTAGAVQPSIWQVHSQADFEAGERDGIAVTSRGVVSLAPAFTPLVETEELYIWSAVISGDDLFVGTGNGGKVFKLNGSELTLFADLEEPDVLSLAWNQGLLYAGVSATGIIYKIAADGEVSIYYESGEIYVWAMVFDDAGNMLIGTGDKGRVHKVTPDGVGVVLYDSPETHIMSLLHGDTGDIYAGSEGHGLVYRIAPDGDPFVLYDATEKEIRRLIMDAEGVLYAAAVSGGGPGSGGPPVPMMIPPGQGPGSMGGSVGTVKGDDALPTADLPFDVGQAVEDPSVTVGQPLQAGSMLPQGLRVQGGPVPRGAGGTGRGSVLYRIDADGVVMPIWRSGNEQLLSLAIQDDGLLLLGTGGEGQLHRVDPVSEAATSLISVDEAQVTVIIPDGAGGMIVGCANIGNLYRLGPHLATTGTLTSPTHDAKTWAKWGRVWWTEPGSGISVVTRSGNSQEPDSTWSLWRPPTGKSGHIDSPNARFVQWRAKLKGSKSVSPILRSLSVSYQQRNLRPRIAFVSVSGRGSQPQGRRSNGGGAPGPQPGPGGASPQQGGPAAAAPQGDNHKPIKGVASIKWGGVDANGDKLSYDLHFRGEAEAEWKLLEEDLPKPSHTWDSETVPDGSYRVKVVATDRPSNGSQALTSAKESDPFVVDNGAPTVVDLRAKTTGGRLTLSGLATDSGSPLQRGVYVVDGGEPEPFFPGDDIFDSGAEEFSFSVELANGEHTVMIRLSDLAGNVGAAKMTMIVGD